jgi:hypothetical protein
MLGQQAWRVCRAIAACVLLLLPRPGALAPAAASSDVRVAQLLQALQGAGVQGVAQQYDALMSHQHSLSRGHLQRSLVFRGAGVSWRRCRQARARARAAPRTAAVRPSLAMVWYSYHELLHAPQGCESSAPVPRDTHAGANLGMRRVLHKLISSAPQRISIGGQLDAAAAACICPLGLAEPACAFAAGWGNGPPTSLPRAPACCPAQTPQA